MIELTVTGMTCGGCVNSVKRAVERVAKGSEPEVDLASGHLTFNASDAEAGAVQQRVIEAIEAAGFGAQAVAP